MKNNINIKETAKFLGVTPATILNWEKHGHLTSIKKNNSVIFKLKEVHHLKNLIDTGQIKRLNSRANKKNSTTSFIPGEYLKNTEEAAFLEKITAYVKNQNLRIPETLFVLTLNLLVEKKIFASLPLNEFLKVYNKNSINLNFQQELNKWQNELTFSKWIDKYQQLLELKLPECEDPLGIVYQSLLSEGEKSKAGSYYTPSEVCLEMAGEYLNRLKGHAKILDLCCGTGQFLIAAGKQIKKMGRLLKPTCLWGYDIDPVAVQIARINLMILFKDFDFSPNIFHRNLIYNYTLDDKIKKNKNFDLILGNPPWGAEFQIEQLSFLKEYYPDILSMESFSYFLYIGLNLLKDDGYLCYLLPESVLNIKTHKDIRNHILNNSNIIQIFCYSRLFSKVFSPVIRLDLQKTSQKQEFIVHNLNTSHTLNPNRFYKNQELIFDIHNTNKDAEILDQIFSKPHLTLKDQSDWVVGIVTGNNELYLSKVFKKGYFKILKGTDIKPFRLNKASNYIFYDPEKLQQASPISKFKVPEKLIYRFISNNLVFAFDDHQHLTLNSANVVIPKINNYSKKAIASLFNSSMYQYIFKRKYFTHKVLRSHIENLPLPILTDNEMERLVFYYDKLNLASYDNEMYKKRFSEFDHFIFTLFCLNDEQQNFIMNRLEFQ